MFSWKKFEKDHDKWRYHVAVLEKEMDSPQGRLKLVQALENQAEAPLVQLHSLKQASKHNGKTGVIRLYSPVKDRFEVVLETGEKLSVLASNLKRLHQDEGTCTENLPVVDRMFTPGARFVGSIHIPCDAGFDLRKSLKNGRQDYEMTILAADTTDEVGNPTGILARHRAYGDEQFVWILIDWKKKRIEYSDGETHCCGSWTTDGTIEGQVYQLISSSCNTTFHTSDKATHTFELSYMYSNSRSPQQHQQIVEEYLETRAMQKDLIRQIQQKQHEWRKLVTPKMLEPLCWKELNHALRNQSEEICAKFRRWSKLLDNIKFETDKERTQTMQRLKTLGLSRLNVHREAEEGVNCVSSFEALHSFAKGVKANYTLQSAMRLSNNVSLFDEAYGRAEKRMATGLLNRFRVDIKDIEGRLSSTQGDSLCSICFIPLNHKEHDNEQSQKLFCLPCSHCFHEGCLSAWLHNHSKCPVCRHDLTSKGI